MEFAPIEPHQDAAMAAIVRAALKEHGLDKGIHVHATPFP